MNRRQRGGEIAHKKTVDFTQGNIVKSIIMFSLPIVLGELIQNLYNSVDAMVVGNLVSKNALAAVTVGGVVANMMIMFFNGMSVGANVVISRAFGQSDEEALHSKIRITFTFSLLLGVLLSALGILFTPQLLQFAGTQDCYPIAWAATTGLLICYYFLTKKLRVVLLKNNT